MKKITYVFTFLLYFTNCFSGFCQDTSMPPVKMAMMGLSHGHAPWVFNRVGKMDMILVGFYEPNTDLAKSYAKRYGLDPNLFFTDASEMLDKVKPEAVLAFGSVYDHLQAVELSAPRGIHVMVEKPLSPYHDHAVKMKEMAETNQIHLLTNYETSWYATTEKTYEMTRDTLTFGKIRKAVFHHGHRGPKEIGVGKEFLNWLTDPVQNGGGALIDFGCYGANIMTYLMAGRKPISVTAVTHTYKPDIYPQVDDEATIVLDYGDAQAIIQASWNWPFDRKDMEIYGVKGQIISENKSSIRWKSWENSEEERAELKPESLGVYTDPFSYFADVIRGKITIPEFSPYSLSNNMIVVEILDAARRSAETNAAVFLDQ